MIKTALAQLEPEDRYNAVKDSGERRKFDTGSQRDISVGKGLPSLIPTYMLRRLAKHYENGARKYGRHNWMLGQPLSGYIDSLYRHVWAVQEGLDDEDHEAAAIWNLVSFMVTRHLIAQGQLPKSLDDMVYTVAQVRPPEPETPGQLNLWEMYKPVSLFAQPNQLSVVNLN